ncbi:MAG: superoxide dismutase, Ni [Candidatus Levybacteria bacterium]|nr:superoxide dismutase, Ni [Candidatus Levybacteria bacterium]
MKVMKSLLQLVPSEVAFAHCDIPCGIYDPNSAQLAAHTVLRMTQLFEEHKDSVHDTARIVHVKEEHGEKVEDALGTLENDYFKSEHYTQFPELKELIAKAVKLSIMCRQKVDMESATDLVETVMLVSEIFYKTKGVTPVRVPSVYPTKGEYVVYK